MTLNLENLSVDANGRTSFSGLSSGIDFRGAVDAMIAAKRIPIDSLETKVTVNADKITALQELSTSLNGMRDSLSSLYGAVSFRNANNIFENKQAFASTSRVDGTTAPAAANLIGVSVTNESQLGSHTIDVIQTAAGHKISSKAYSKTTDPLGLTSGDAFTIDDPNGDPVTITMSGTETLLDLRNRINNANSGTNATGITASIVSVSTSEHYLILTREGGDVPINLVETIGNPLQDLDFFDGSSAIAHELQAAQMAQFYADGILDQTDTIYETSYQTLGTQVGSAGTITFSVGAGPVDTAVAYLATDTLATLATKITAAVADVTATVVVDGAGERLEISGTQSFTMAETAAGTALTDLGINNKRKLSEYATNTITETFTGVTLSLFQASAGTTIKFDIERDLTAVKTEIVNFVTAYNDTRAIINSHRMLDSQTGAASDDAGVLFGSNALKEVDQALNQILGQGVTGVSDEFKIFAQIGINFINNNALSDDLERDTLIIDETKLDAALLSNTADVRRLFSFDFTTSDPRVSLLGFDANTTHSVTGYTLNIQPSAGNNMLLYSEQLDNAAWTTPGSAGNDSISADAIAAPDGSMTADGFVAEITNSTHYLSNATAFTVTAGETYTYSTYLKAGDKSDARVVLTLPGFATNARADFDLTGSGSVTSMGPLADDASITSVGDGWYRVSIKATSASSGTAKTETYPKDGGNIAFSGDGATANIYIWGAQVEIASENSIRVANNTFANTRGTIVPNDTTAPDGTMTADSFTSDATNNSHYVSSGGHPVVDGQTYTMTTYLKPGDHTQARLTLTGMAASTNVNFDLTGAGSVISSGAGTDSVTIEYNAGTGWYKVSLTTTSPGAASAGIELNSLIPNADSSYVGDNNTTPPDLYYWGMALVPQTSPTSYVATTSASASGAVATTNIGGGAEGLYDGSTETDTNTINVLTGGAKGLRLFFDGFSFGSSVQLDFTVGAGAQLFSRLGELLDSQVGVIETEMDTLTEQNTLNSDRINEMLLRLEIKRADLLQRFIRMETTLATANRILDSIKQTSQAMLKSNN